MERLTWNCIPLGKIGNELFMPSHPQPPPPPPPLPHRVSFPSQARHFGLSAGPPQYASPFLSRPPRVALSSVTFSSGAGAGPIPVQSPLHHPARAAPCLAQYVSIIFHSGLIVYHPNGLICTRPPTLYYCIVTDFVPHAAIISRCVPRWVGECGCFD